VHFGNGHISHTNEWKHLSENITDKKPNSPPCLLVDHLDLR